MSWENLSRSKVKVTRKDHACFGCNKAIEVGSECYRIAGVCEGSFHAYRLCGECAAVESEFCQYGDTYSQGDLGDYRREKE